ncbi:MAG: AAA family ATPase [Chitinophagaceae bacterium]|nr:AAA family ATPase [Chitinophagaceae bacterium]
MERLQVRNFGPIESIDIEIKDINIFIGKTSSGKSTVAKLISIFKSVEFAQFEDIRFFKKKLADFNIEFEIKDSTVINYSNDTISVELINHQFKSDHTFREVLLRLDHVFSSYQYGFEQRWDAVGLLLDSPIPEVTAVKNGKENQSLQRINKKIKEIGELRTGFGKGELTDFDSLSKKYFSLLKDLVRESNVYNSLYVPAERILLSMIAESLFGLLRNEVSIARSIKDFGAKFEKARSEIKKTAIDFLGIEFEYDDNVNFIKLSNNTRIRLEHTSSGYQSVTPLFLVLEYFLNRKELFKNCIVIEEPESNLYPTAQKDLIEYIISGKLISEDKLFITTHSPYVLTTIDNLIQAYNVAVREGKSPEEVEKIVPRKFWIDFDKVTCYYFENGSCRSTMDRETMTIGTSNIDDVSIQLGKTFDELISLKYN